MHKNAYELTAELDELSKGAVKKRMIADVPLGTFLSGGFDSTTVTAIMQTQSNQPVRTFSIGVHSENIDEAQHAKAVAQFLGTDHTELYVTSEEAMEVIPRLPVMWDEPFSDSSQIPTFLVSKLARQHVTVSLSGDGGDELFAEYNRHIVGLAAWDKARRFPLQLRRAMGLGIGCLARHDLEGLRRYLPQRMAVPNLADRLDKLAGALNAPSRQAFYKDLFSHWDGKGKWLLRYVLYKYVPQEIMDRPKMGFGVPIEHCLRGSLHEWAQELLREKRLREEGFFDRTDPEDVGGACERKTAMALLSLGCTHISGVA